MDKSVGLDPGTMFFQMAERDNDSVITKEIRNSFVQMEKNEEIEQVLSQNNWQYVSDDKSYYIIGEDSIRVARMFPGKVELRRPMQDGVLNKNEDKKMLVMASIIEDLIGQAPSDKSMVCTCVSSECIDLNTDNSFHKARLEGMISRLGWNTKVIEEGHAVVLSEKPEIIDENNNKVPFSGIGISFGSGRSNCVLVFRGLPVIGMSCNRGGDWIDSKVSEQTGMPISQITGKKESDLDFEDVAYNEDDDVLFALDVYYTSLIQYVFSNFAKKFKEVKSEFNYDLPIVLAGGTSMPNGFREKVEKIVKKLDLPFGVKEVIMSKDPRNSVVKGLLTQSIISQKKL